MADGPTTFDYFTLGIAAVGAVSGLAAIGATSMQGWLSGPRLKVTAGTALGGDTKARFYLSVNVENRGRTAASVPGVNLRVEGHEDKNLLLGMLRTQGHAAGPPFKHRLDPFESETWLVEVEPLIQNLREEGLPTRVRPFLNVGGKRVQARRPVDLALIASYNDR